METLWDCEHHYHEEEKMVEFKRKLEKKKGSFILKLFFHLLIPSLFFATITLSVSLSVNSFLFS